MDRGREVLGGRFAGEEDPVFDGHADLAAQALFGADRDVGIGAKAVGILVPTCDQVFARLRDLLPIHFPQRYHQGGHEFGVAAEFVFLAGRARAEGQQHGPTGDFVEIDNFGPVTIRASHIADQLVVLVPENRGEFEEDFVENAHAGFADGLAFASRQARVKGDPSRPAGRQGAR